MTRGDRLNAISRQEVERALSEFAEADREGQWVDVRFLRDAARCVAALAVRIPIEAAGKLSKTYAERIVANEDVWRYESDLLSEQFAETLANIHDVNVLVGLLYFPSCVGDHRRFALAGLESLLFPNHLLAPTAMGLALSPYSVPAGMAAHLLQGISSATEPKRFPSDKQAIDWICTQRPATGVDGKPIGEMR